MSNAVIALLIFILFITAVLLFWIVLFTIALLAFSRKAKTIREKTDAA
jgi:hypothetical protein